MTFVLGTLAFFITLWDVPLSLLLSLDSRYRFCLLQWGASLFLMIIVAHTTDCYQVLSGYLNFSEAISLAELKIHFLRLEVLRAMLRDIFSLTGGHDTTQVLNTPSQSKLFPLFPAAQWVLMYILSGVLQSMTFTRRSISHPQCSPNDSKFIASLVPGIGLRGPSSLIS